MRNKLLFFLALLLTMMVQVTWAQHVTQEQAKEIASQFLKGQSTKQGGRRNAPAASALKTAVVFNAKDTSGQPYLYAVTDTRQSGFVLVSGDERFPVVLGYTDDGTFDEQNMPENMRDFLQGYIDEMKYLLSINYQPSESARRTAPAAFATIAPMLTSQWNQGYPYNMYCPQYDNYGNKCPTGCLATALAQVMCYQGNNKKTGQSTNTLKAIPAYQTSTMKYNIAEKPTRTFDWTKMTGTTPSTPEAIEEVARLMEYIGSGVKIDYRQGGTGGSVSYIPSLMTDVFGYDSKVREVNRNNYSDYEWLNMMYHELSANGPVMYGGQATNGGHGFVLDGYKYENNEHLFHINWGWGGMSDGYFLLSVCYPDKQGIGGSTSQAGFNRAQAAIIDMDPNGSGTQQSNIRLYDYKITLDKTSFTRNSSSESFQLTGIQHLFANILLQTYTFDFGIGWVNTNGEITHLAEYTQGYSLNYGRAINCTNATYYTPTGVTDGEYRLIGISKEHGTNTWWRNNNSENYYIRATVSGNQLTLEICNANSIQLTGSMTTTGNTVGQAVTVTASVTNNGSLYSGDLMLAQIESGGSPVIVDQKQVEIAKGSTATVNFSYTPTKAGNFTLVLLNKQNQTFGSQQSITINAATGGTQIYTVRNSQGRDIKYQKDGNLAKVVAGGNYSGNVIIPDYVNLNSTVCAVAEIGPQAFYNTSLTDITIPNTVTRINTNAFYGSTLRTVTYQGTSALQRIEAGAFSGLNYLTTITIPASVNYIGNSAFAGSSQLASVTVLQTTPATLGSNVFAGNASGRKIYVPDEQVATYQGAAGWSTYASDIVSQLSVGQTFEEGGLTYEITNATEGSKAVKLTSSTATGAVEIPSSVKGFTVTAIGADAFKNTTVTSVVIPATVTAIGANAFSSCSNLSSVTIWATAVPTLASDIFSGANASLEIFVYGNLVGGYQTALSDVSSKIKPIQFTEANTADVNINYDMMSPTEARVSINAATGALEIPATVFHQGTNYSVTSIAEGAFQNCTGLSSVILPESITEIGANAFNGCSALTSVTIWATSVPTLDNANAFSSTPNFYIWGDLKDSYVVATNWSSFAPVCYAPITYTTDGIKYKLASATSATVVSTSPKYSGDIVIQATITLRGHTLNVTGIGDEAFDNCSGVTSVSIPESVTSIGRYTFYNCTGLREVMIPNSVTSVGYSAFEGCTNLNEASLGTGVTSIDSRAFYGCTNLYRVTVFATSVPTLGTEVFDQNASGRRIYVPADSKAYYKAATNWNAYADYIFDISTATGFQSGEFDFVITNDNVGERTVKVTGVHDVWTPMTIPSTVVNDGNTYTVTSIAANAFAERSVFYAEIPSTVTSIGNQAFYHCNTLATVKMESATPPVLGTEVFDGHYQGQSVQDMFHIRVPLTSIVAYQESGNWASYGSDITAWTDGNIADGIYYTFDDGKLTVNNAPYDAPYEGHIVIPEEVCGFPVVAIGAYAFANNEAGQYNKKKCNATSVTIPNTVTKIENFAFFGSHITSIEIPNSVTTIEQQAFQGCENLTSVTIGNGISSIGYNAFNAHPNPLTYTIQALIPPTLGTTPFPTNGVGTFYVPSTSVSAYQGNATWSTYNSYIYAMTSFKEDGVNYGIISEDVKTAQVLASTYSGDLVIPEWVNGYQVTKIEQNAFKDCTTLTSVSIPSTVTEIGGNAFNGCSSLSAIIVNSTSLPSLGSIQTFDGNATGRKIFVVSSLWSGYKAAPNWSSNASDILPFVDYEEGSWIGEADEVGFTTRQLKNYTHVTSSTTTFEDGKWYVVTESVSNDNRITVQGTAHLVLCDGVTMDQYAGFGVTGGNTLNIYGQSEGTGGLFANSNGRYAAIGGNSDNSNCGTINIHGGVISCNSSAYGAGIGGGQGGNGGTVTIFGGKVNTSSISSVGIGMGAGGADDGTLSLGANTIVLGGLYQHQTMQLERPYNSRFTIMNVTPALILDEDIDNSEAIAQADGKTMAVSMKRTLKAGGWNTFCMPCTVSGGFLFKALGDDVQMKKLTGSSFDESTGELNLTFADAEEIQGAKTIEAGKPYLVKVSQDVINPLFTSAEVHREVTNIETECVDFLPVMLPTEMEGGDKSILFVTGGNKFTYPKNTSTMLSFRAYFKLHEGVAASARFLNIDFGDGEATGVIDIRSKTEDLRGDFYDLQGRKVEKPARGLYIKNGKKVFIK